MLNHSNHNGFTLIELLIVIAIFTLIMGFTFANFFSAKQKVDLDNTTKEIVALLREAQSNATYQTQGLNWGVYISNPTSSPGFFALYSSSTYDPKWVVNYYQLPVDLKFSRPTSGSAFDINFSQVSGLPSLATSVSIYVVSSSSMSSTINIATSGLISF